MTTPKFSYITINNTKFTKFHLSVFVLTFFCYALFHASRKAFSNVKTTISDEWQPSCDSDNHTCVPLKPDSRWNKHTFFTDHASSKLFLGALDAIFLAAYSIGLFISGILGDRFNLRYVLFIGMTSSALCLFLFGVVTEWLGFYSKWFYILIWIINGFTQSTGWPAVVAVMGNWFGKNGRGLIFGIWAANQSVGNILGALMVASCLNYGYHYAFLLTSSVFFIGGIVVFFGLVPTPKEVGLPEVDSEEKEEENNDEHLSDTDEPLVSASSAEKTKPIGFIQAVLLPGVIMYSLCYAFLKMINYSFLFWLPFYLSNKFHWSETSADQISIWYDVGGIAGGIIGGLASDFLKKRSIIIVIMLVLAIPSLWIFSESPNSELINALLMSVVGFFVGGASNMISATITADLGRQDAIKGNKEGLSTVTGIVDGTGSIGAALGQLLVPLIQEKFNWFYVFYLFITLCVLTNFCILPLFYRECKEVWQAFKLRRSGRSGGLGNYEETSYMPINTDNEDN